MTIDPLQLQAEATSIAGDAVATWLLGKNGSSAVPGLTKLATLLPSIVLGKVSAFDMGTLSIELQAINTQVKGQSQDLINQVGSITALVSTSQSSATGGPVTATQALLMGIAANVQIGINNALQFFAGQQAGLAAAASAASSANSRGNQP